MTLTDDMVFVPSIGKQHVAAAPTRARDERRLAGARRRHGPLAKIQAARIAAKMRSRHLAARSGSRMLGMARRGTAAMGRGIAGRFGARAMATPVGAIAMAVLVAGVVALRLSTGEPLEGTAEKINKMVLGDMDDEARAKMATRHQLQSDSDLTRIVGNDGAANSQIASIADDLFKINKRNELGASLLRSEFPANNVLDMLILRAAKAFNDAFRAHGGPDATARFRERYKAARSAPDGKPGGR